MLHSVVLILLTLFMGSENVTKTLHAIEIEQAILGSILMDAELSDEIISNTSENLFYDHKHKKIYSALKQMHKAKADIDILTIESKMKDLGQLDSIGGIAYIIELTNKVPSAANWSYYNQILIEKAIARSLYVQLNNNISELNNPEKDVYDVLEEVENALRITSNMIVSNVKSMSDLKDQYINRLDVLIANKHKYIGFVVDLEIDNHTNGFEKGHFIVIAARPSMGKTALALTFAKNMACSKNNPQHPQIAIFSLESSDISFLNRMVSQSTGIPAQKLRTGNITQNEHYEVIQMLHKIEQWPLDIIEASGINIDDFERKVAYLVHRKNVNVIFIDYLQLMTSGKKQTFNREQEVSEISRRVKALTLRYNIAIIALSQLSRKVEERANKRPMLSDLRESGSIEQDADSVLFIHREEYYLERAGDKNIDEEKKGLATIIIAKQREGELGDIKLYFDKSNLQFKDWHEKPRPSASAANPFDITDTDRYGDDHYGDDEPF